MYAGIYASVPAGGSRRGRDAPKKIFLKAEVCYNEIMLKSIIPVISLISLAMLIVLLNFTTPTSLGPVGVLLFFVLVYVIMLGVATLAVVIFRKILGKKGEMGRKDYGCAAVIAFAPILLLVNQSLGILNLFTIAIVAATVFLGCFWILKRG